MKLPAGNAQAFQTAVAEYLKAVESDDWLRLFHTRTRLMQEEMKLEEGGQERQAALLKLFTEATFGELFARTLDVLVEKAGQKAVQALSKPGWTMKSLGLAQATDKTAQMKDDSLLNVWATCEMLSSSRFVSSRFCRLMLRPRSSSFAVLLQPPASERFNATNRISGRLSRCRL